MKARKRWKQVVGGVTLLLLLARVAPNYVSAQEGEKFSFGPPLRDNIVFTYTYTERVKTWISENKGQQKDSSERILTYYISQKQTPSTRGDGAKNIEVYIDSMNVDYRGAGGDVYFSTQEMKHITDKQRISHQAVLVPSTLVSSLANFTLSPYGQLVDMESKSFDNLHKQSEDPLLDDFTQYRIGQMIREDFLSTIYFPWRNVLPSGREVTYDVPVRLPSYASLDRLLFNDSVTVTLNFPDEDNVSATDRNTDKSRGVKPILRFSSTLENPQNEWMTITGVDSPVLVSSAQGVLSGELHLDVDGVVLSGWSAASGSAKGKSRGKEIMANFTHEVYIKLDDMKAFATN